MVHRRNLTFRRLLYALYRTGEQILELFVIWVCFEPVSVLLNRFGIRRLGYSSRELPHSAGNLLSGLSEAFHDFTYELSALQPSHNDNKAVAKLHAASPHGHEV